MKKSIIYLGVVLALVVSATLISCEKLDIQPNSKADTFSSDGHYVEKTTPIVYEFGNANPIEIRLVDSFRNKLAIMKIFSHRDALEIQITPLIPNLDLMDAALVIGDLAFFPLDPESGEPLYDKTPYKFVKGQKPTILSEIEATDANLDGKPPVRNIVIHVDLADIPDEGAFSLYGHFITNTPSASNGWNPNVYVWNEGIRFENSVTAYSLYKKSK